MAMRWRRGGPGRIAVLALIAGTVLASMMLGAGAATAVAPPKAPLRVELWGDSLSVQSTDYVHFYLGLGGKVQSREHVYGGTALCDYLPDIRSEINPANRSGFHPQVALIQFSGNAFTKCMQDSHGRPYAGQALVGKYAADSATAIALFAKEKIAVYFVSSPISANDKTSVNDTPLGLMYSRLPAGNPGKVVRYIDAAMAVEWRGRFSWTLPCQSFEKCTGRWADGTRTVVVRQSDGVHFCPVAETAVLGVVPKCPVYSGGAARFALAMRNRVSIDYHLG